MLVIGDIVETVHGKGEVMQLHDGSAYVALFDPKFTGHNGDFARSELPEKYHDKLWWFPANAVTLCASYQLIECQECEYEI